MVCKNPVLVNDMQNILPTPQNCPNFLSVPKYAQSLQHMISLSRNCNVQCTSIDIQGSNHSSRPNMDQLQCYNFISKITRPYSEYSLLY